MADRSRFRSLVPLFVALCGLYASGAAAQYSTPMRDVENPDRFPYMERASINIAQNFVNGIADFPTPAGYRYVIEYVAVTCYTPSASDYFPSVILSTTKITSPNSATFLNPAVVMMQRAGPGAFGGYLFHGSALVKIYSDAGFPGGSGISINISHADFSVAAQCNAYVYGHTFKL